MLFIRVEREKKNIPRILAKFGEVVGSLSGSMKKKFDLPRWRGRRVGGSRKAPSFEKNVLFCFYLVVKMACDFWNSTKKVQFEFLHLSELLPCFSDQNSFFYPEVKKLRIAKNESFYFSKKCN